MRVDLGWLGVFKADKVLQHLDFIIYLTFSKMSPYLLNQKQEVIPQSLEPAYHVKMLAH